MGLKFSFSRREGGRSRPAAGEAVSDEGLCGRRSRLPLIFFAIFFLVGSGFMVPFAIVVAKVIGSRNWVPTPCVIVSSTVKKHRGEKGYTYSIEMVFRYEFGDKEYESHTYDFSPGSSSGYRSKARVVERYPAGKKATCYVNPRKPSQAVISRQLPAIVWFAFIPAVFVAIGLGGLVGMFRARRQPSARPSAPSWLPQVAPKAPATGLRLKPKVSPRLKTVLVALFALVWNGVVSLFAHKVIVAWRVGRGSWFETLFLVPFVLVGLGVIVAASYQFLRLFNPRPVITVGQQSLPLGGRTWLEWALVGRVDAVRRLEVYLEGREQATYQRGTNTITSQGTFLTVPLVETTDRYEILAGKAEIAVPPDTMHTFEAPNNKVLWRLVVKGDVRRWPDIEEEYPIVVLPAQESARS